jgi:hypothetical protein
MKNWPICLFSSVSTHEGSPQFAATTSMRSPIRAQLEKEKALCAGHTHVAKISQVTRTSHFLEVFLIGTSEVLPGGRINMMNRE